MKSKMKWLVVLLMGLTVSTIASLFNATNVEAQEEDPVYIIGTDTTFAPFEFMEDGEYVGIDMDLLAAIAEDQGFEYEIRPMGFSAALQALESQQIDGMIAGMGITEDRLEVFDFSESYYQAGVQFAVLEDSEIQTIEDLEGETVAVKTGTTGSEAAAELAEEIGFELNYFEDSVNMYEDLDVGNSVAVIEDYPVMAYAAETGDIPLRFIGEQMAITEYGFAVPQGENAELLDMFNDGLANLQDSGQYDEIIGQYLGEVEPVDADAPANDAEANDVAEDEEDDATAEDDEEDPASEEAETEEDEDAVVAEPIEGKVYTIGTDTTFAPFEFIEDGEYVGIDMDILNAIAEDQGFEFELNPMGFSAALQALETEQVDGVIAGMGITDEREEAFDFSDTYYQAGAQFAVLEDSEIETLEDLDGENVAVKTGTTGAAAATEMSEEYGFTVTQFEDSVNMYEDLMANNSAAVIEDYPVMAYAAQSGDVPLRFIGEQVAIVDYGFAVPMGENPELLAMFNEGLANIQESGELEEIIVNYLGEEPEVAEEEEESALSDIPIVALVQNNWEPLLEGLWTTIWITLIAFAIALVGGIIVGLMRTSGNILLIGIAQVYIDIMRGIPLIVLSFFIYFGVPNFTGWNFNAYTAGLLTLSLNAAAYIAEIVRGGIQAVSPGQSEAGRSLGLSQGKTMRHIVLPQAFRIMIPSFINQFVITLKDTSILSVIGMVELTQTGRIIIARTYQSGNMWLIIGIMYIVLITILTKISNRLERNQG